MLKLKETLTQNEITDLVVNSTPITFFPYIITEDDSYYKYLYDLNIGYYFNRSGEKLISPTFKNFKEISDNYYELLGTYIRNKFSYKWKKVYEALENTQYTLEHEYTYSETKNGTNTDKTNYNSSTTLTGNNKDEKTYDTETINDGNVGVDETTTRNTDSDSGIWGFNSSTPAPTETENMVLNESFVKDKDKNTTHNIETKTGTDTIDYSLNQTESKDGDDTKTFTINESKNINGRKNPITDLIEKELNLRNKELFFDIVYKDLDSVLTLSIY